MPWPESAACVPSHAVSPCPCPSLPPTSLAEVLSATICSRASPDTPLSFTDYCDNRGREVQSLSSEISAGNSSEQKAAAPGLPAEAGCDVSVSSEIPEHRAHWTYAPAYRAQHSQNGLRDSSPTPAQHLQTSGDPRQQEPTANLTPHTKGQEEGEGGSVLKATLSPGLRPQECSSTIATCLTQPGEMLREPRPATAQWEAL